MCVDWSGGVGEKKVDIASNIHSRYLDLLLDDKQQKGIVSPNVAMCFRFDS